MGKKKKKARIRILNVILLFIIIIIARSYATEAPAADKLRLTFVLPHKALYKATDVQQVNLAATSGDMGILANHVPTIEQLNPGIVEVIESGDVTKKFFGKLYLE